MPLWLKLAPAEYKEAVYRTDPTADAPTAGVQIVSGYVDHSSHAKMTGGGLVLTRYPGREYCNRLMLMADIKRSLYSRSY